MTYNRYRFERATDMNLSFDLNDYNIGDKELSKDKNVFYIVRNNCNAIKMKQ